MMVNSPGNDGRLAMPLTRIGTNIDFKKKHTGVVHDVKQLKLLYP